MNFYNLDRAKKGLAIIINNLHNEQKATRNDVRQLQSMFQKINVQLDQIKIDQDKSELREIANDLRDKDLSSYNLFFLVVLSHGILGDKIVCMNGTKQSTFDVEYFVESLSQNESMSGYPKILIFDFCRGGEVNLGEMRQAPTSRIPFGSGVNSNNILRTSFMLVDPKSIKNTVKSSMSFYTFGIYETKSCT
jgi:hypothetical protein